MSSSVLETVMEKVKSLTADQPRSSVCAIKQSSLALDRVSDL
jgi:hypothetical protein